MNIKIFLFTISVFTIISTTNLSAHVVLDYPVGGENFMVGNVVTIQWHVAIYHGPCDWDLYFSSNGGVSWEPIVENLPEAQLTYDWTIPNIPTGSGRVRVIQDNATGADYDYASGNFSIISATGVGDDETGVNTYQLSNAYPNPFNPTTTIRYSVPTSGNVKISVFNVIGEEVKELVNDYKPAGNYQIEFSADGLSSGTYLYRIEADGFVAAKKMILLK